MNLPNIISDLITAQANFDSQAYAKCFSKTALVFDENEVHKGQNEIEKWNEKTNKIYKTELDILDFSVKDTSNILMTKVTGTFEGSPIVLKYHFELKNEMIERLKITA